MRYKVHRFEINMESDPRPLEEYLNRLKGEVVAVIPNIARTSLGQIYGLTRKVNFLLIVERI